MSSSKVLKTSQVRETYEILKTFEVDGKSIIYKRSNGGRKIYEEVQTTSDAEINAVTNAMHREPLDSFRTVCTFFALSYFLFFAFCLVLSHDTHRHGYGDITYIVWGVSRF